MKKQKKIQKYERYAIAYFLGKGMSHRKIADILGRSNSSISSEIDRNSVNDIYDPEKANHKAYVNRKYAKYQGMKIAENTDLRNYVEKRIKNGWSPEEISERLKRTNLPNISFKSIYNYIDSAYGRQLENHLRHYKKKGRKYYPPSHLKNRVFIEDRLEITNSRGRFGDYEVDFIVSGKNGRGSLLVLIDRLSRYCFIKKVDTRKADKINMVIYKTLSHVSVRSLTMDNDVSFQKHAELSMMLGCPIYFTHPYHSWEKGSVENMNKLIRQYVRKGSDISKYSKKNIKDIEYRLRNRPRKCLNYLTPYEVMIQNNCFKRPFNVKLEVIKKSEVCGLRG